MWVVIEFLRYKVAYRESNQVELIMGYYFFMCLDKDWWPSKLPKELRYKRMLITKTILVTFLYYRSHVKFEEFDKFYGGLCNFRELHTYEQIGI
jgi:hypothetical protein